MHNLIILTSKDRDALLKIRKGETKFGEHIKLLSNFSSIYDAINDLDVDYVIFGIPESIGVYANLGKTGTQKAWNAALKA